MQEEHAADLERSVKEQQAAAGDRQKAQATIEQLRAELIELQATVPALKQEAIRLAGEV